MRPENDRHHCRLCYRVKQFWSALQASPPTESQLRQARSVLTDPQMALFTRLQPSEQAHSLQVLQSLLESRDTHPDLLVAALLHDIGKICHPLRIWERVVIVLVKRWYPGRLESWGQGEPSGWKRPFVISCQHAEWGAELVSNTDASPLLVSLIREHEVAQSGSTPDDLKEQLLEALQKADDWS